MSSFSDRMKRYEKSAKLYLTRRTPVIIRVDGKAFSTLTRGLNKPFDEVLHDIMCHTAKFLCKNIQGAELAYTQSDEISILLTDYEKLNTEAWFDYNVQKLCSVSASFATAQFNYWLRWAAKNFIRYRNLPVNLAHFDSRAFNLPKEEVVNYFIWRQKDATRNSIQGLGQHHFSHNQMQGLSNNQVQDKLMKEKGINWNNLYTWKKRGTCVKKQKVKKYIEEIGEEVETFKWQEDMSTPVFNKDREYINKLIYKEAI